MNPELLAYYQELVDICDSKRNCEYESFRVDAEFPDWGLTLSLKYVDKDGADNELTPVPVEVFRVIHKIRASDTASPSWSEWIFEYNRNGKYNISVKYPDSAEPEVNR